jgi:RNA recognition motif-containing protein
MTVQNISARRARFPYNNSALALAAGGRSDQNRGTYMTKLYVGGLPYSTTDESLLQLFAEKGFKPVSARIITERETGRSRGFGFVELGPGDDAAKAIGEFNGMNVEGRALQVNEARPQESRGGGGRGFSGGRTGRGGRRNY